MKNSEVYLKHDVREYTKSRYKHGPGDVRKKYVEDALKKIKGKDVLNVAENRVARAKFMQLRSQKHNFV